MNYGDNDDDEWHNRFIYCTLQKATNSLYLSSPFALGVEGNKGQSIEAKSRQERYGVSNINSFAITGFIPD